MHVQPTSDLSPCLPGFPCLNRLPHSICLRRRSLFALLPPLSRAHYRPPRSLSSAPRWCPMRPPTHFICSRAVTSPGVARQAGREGVATAPYRATRCRQAGSARRHCTAATRTRYFHCSCPRVHVARRPLPEEAVCRTPRGWASLTPRLDPCGPGLSTVAPCQLFLSSCPCNRSACWFASDLGPDRAPGRGQAMPPPPPTPCPGCIILIVRISYCRRCYYTC